MPPIFKGFFWLCVMGFLFGTVVKEGLGMKKKAEKWDALKIEIGNR